MNVDVALIPAAGRGTRMRPATNAVPKALLTVVDRPSIQWVVEEAVRAGVSEVVVVVDPDTGGMIERHFAALPHLAGVTVRPVVQEQAKGLGDAVLTGRRVVGDRPFFVMTADDLILPGASVLDRLAASARRGGSVLCVRRLPRPMLASKGVIVPGAEVNDARGGSTAERWRSPRRRGRLPGCASRAATCSHRRCSMRWLSWDRDTAARYS